MLPIVKQSTLESAENSSWFGDLEIFTEEADLPGMLKATGLYYRHILIHTSGGIRSNLRNPGKRGHQGNRGSGKLKHLDDSHQNKKGIHSGHSFQKGQDPGSIHPGEDWGLG